MHQALVTMVHTLYCDPSYQASDRCISVLLVPRPARAVRQLCDVSWPPQYLSNCSIAKENQPQDRQFKRICLYGCQRSLHHHHVLRKRCLLRLQHGDLTVLHEGQRLLSLARRPQFHAFTVWIWANGLLCYNLVPPFLHENLNQRVGR